MKRKLIYAGLLSTFLFSSSQALPLINGEIYAGYMSQDPTGWIQYKGNAKNDLGLDREGSYFVKAKLELPIILIPNLYLQFVNMDFSGSGRLQRTITIDNKTYTAGANITTDLKMDRYDVGIYYNVPMVNELTAGIVDLEAGINIRIIDFEAKVSDGTRTAKADAVIPLPLLYAGAEIKPPIVDFVSFMAEGKGIRYSDNYYYEFSAELRFKPVGLLVTDPFLAVGYRYERLKIDDIDGNYGDIRIKQPYIALGLMF